MDSKQKLFRRLVRLLVEDLKKIVPTPPSAKRVVPYMTKIVWTLAALMFAYVTAGVLVGL